MAILISSLLFYCSLSSSGQQYNLLVSGLCMESVLTLWFHKLYVMDMWFLTYLSIYFCLHGKRKKCPKSPEWIAQLSLKVVIKSCGQQIISSFPCCVSLQLFFVQSNNEKIINRPHTQLKGQFLERYLWLKISDHVAFSIWFSKTRWFSILLPNSWSCMRY